MKVHVYRLDLISGTWDLHTIFYQQAFIRLNPYNQFIRIDFLGLVAGENMMRGWLEMHHNLCYPGGQLFAGPDIKWNIFPTPVINIKLNPKISLGAAVWIHPVSIL